MAFAVRNEQEKKNLKILQKYSKNFEVKSPYNVIVGPFFCQSVAERRISLEDGIGQLLLNRELTLYTTRCCINELQNLADKGEKKYVRGAHILRTLKLLPCKHKHFQNKKQKTGNKKKQGWKCVDPLKCLALYMTLNNNEPATKVTNKNDRNDRNDSNGSNGSNGNSSNKKKNKKKKGKKGEIYMFAIQPKSYLFRARRAPGIATIWMHSAKMVLDQMSPASLKEIKLRQEQSYQIETQLEANAKRIDALTATEDEMNEMNEEDAINSFLNNDNDSDSDDGDSDDNEEDDDVMNDINDLSEMMQMNEMNEMNESDQNGDENDLDTERDVNDSNDGNGGNDGNEDNLGQVGDLNSLTMDEMENMINSAFNENEKGKQKSLKMKRRIDHIEHENTRLFNKLNRLQDRKQNLLLQKDKNNNNNGRNAFGEPPKKRRRRSKRNKTKASNTSNESGKMDEIQDEKEANVSNENEDDAMGKLMEADEMARSELRAQTKQKFERFTRYNDWKDDNNNNNNKSNNNKRKDKEWKVKWQLPKQPSKKEKMAAETEAIFRGRPKHNHASNGANNRNFPPRQKKPLEDWFNQ